MLHGVVTDARTQRRKGETPGANRWREDLQPREAVRARTTITLERERDLLRARLAQVGVTLSHVFAELKHLLCRWREKTWSCTVKYRSTRRHRSEQKLVLRRSSHSSTRLVPVLCSVLRVTHASWSDLRKVGGIATGGPAVVDAVNGGDAECD